MCPNSRPAFRQPSGPNTRSPVPHLLILELPGGNDFTVIEDAVAAGHEVTLATSDLGHYRSLGAGADASLSLVVDTIEVQPFDYDRFEIEVLARNASHPFDAVLCLVDIRVIDASRVASRLGLRFLNVDTARLTRDKTKVRDRLARANIRQPRFARARTSAELRDAVFRVGYPCVVKPSDGYGSQSVTLLSGHADLEALEVLFRGASCEPIDYGLGTSSSGSYSVEQYIVGNFIGCDVFASHGQRTMLGINDKLMFPPPSFAIRGSCFPSSRYDAVGIRDYAFSILDALDFDMGATHIEMIVANGEPYLVEVNARLVSAQIPYQMGYAFERSIYLDLVDLHLGKTATEFGSIVPIWFSAIRWFSADRAGKIARFELPHDTPDSVRRVVLLKGEGDEVAPPLQNADRLGYVIAVGASQEQAEQIADSYIAATCIEVRVAPLSA